MKKFIRQLILFGFTLCVCNVFIHILLPDSFGIKHGSNTLFHSQYETYKKSTVPYNTLFVGSSRTYRHIDPHVFDSICMQKGIRSFNLGSPATFNPEAFYLLEKIMSEKKPPVQNIIIELGQINFIKAVNWFAPQSYYYLDYSLFRSSMEIIWTQPDIPLWRKMVNAWPYVQGFIINHTFYYPPLQVTEEKEAYNGYLKNGYYSLDDEVVDFSPKGLVARRLTFLSDTSVLQQRAAKQLIGQQYPPHEMYAMYLNELIEQTAAKNVNLYFIIPPKLQKYSALQKIASRIKRGHVMDLGSAAQYPEFYMAQYSFDIGHLNRDGAKLYTQYAAEAFMDLP